MTLFTAKTPKGAGGLFGGSRRKPWEIEPMHGPGRIAPAPTPAPAPEKKGGFFSEGGAGRGIAGALGDYLLQVNGIEPIYAPQQRYNQQAANQQQMAQQSRQWGMEDFKAEHDYKVANPTPQKPTTMQQKYEYIAATKGPEAADKFMQNQIDPPVWRPDAYGQFYRVDTGPQSFGAFNPNEWEVVE